MLTSQMLNISRYFSKPTLQHLLIDMPYYAVRIGRKTGVFTSWRECEEQVRGYVKPRFKKFPSESQAWDFVNCTGEFSGETPVKQSGSPSPLKTPGVFNHSKPASSAVRNLDWDDELPVPPSTCLTPTIESSSGSLNTKTLLSLKSCVNKMKTNMDQMRNYIHQAEGYIEELQSGQKRCQSENGPKKRVKAAEEFQSGQKRSQSENGPKKRVKTEEQMEEVHNGGPMGGPAAVVYTDGACFNNGTDHAKAGIGVYWGPNNPMNLSQRLGGRQTNNRAEIHAAIRAIEQAKQMGIAELTVKTDSNFMIQSITKWIHGWKKNGWKLSTGNPVVNRDDFEELDAVMQGIKVHWEHVRGHQGIEGNEIADRLANQGAKLPAVHR